MSVWARLSSFFVPSETRSCSSDTVRWDSLWQADRLQTEAFLCVKRDSSFKIHPLMSVNLTQSAAAASPLIIRRRSARRVVSSVWGIWELSAWMEIPQSSYYPRCIIQPVSHWARLLQNGAKWRDLKIHTDSFACFSWLTANAVYFTQNVPSGLRLISFFPGSLWFLFLSFHFHIILCPHVDASKTSK